VSDSASNNISHIPEKSSHGRLEQKLVLGSKLAELMSYWEVRVIKAHFCRLRVNCCKHGVLSFFGFPRTLLEF